MYVKDLKLGMLLTSTAEGIFSFFNNRLHHVWIPGLGEPLQEPIVYLGKRSCVTKNKGRTIKRSLVREVMTTRGIKQIRGQDFRYLQPLEFD